MAKRQLGETLAVGNFTDRAATARLVSESITAGLVSPSFSGTPTTPTPASSDSSIRLANTAFTQGAIDLQLTPESLGVFDLDNAPLNRRVMVNGIASDTVANHWPVTPFLSGAPIRWIVETLGTASRRTQFAILAGDLANDRYLTYTRSYDGVSWLPWTRLLTSADFNELNAAITAEPLHAHAYRSTNYAVATPFGGSGWQQMSLDSKTAASSSAFNTATGRFTPPAGIYQLSASSLVAHTANADIVVSIWQNEGEWFRSHARIVAGAIQSMYSTGIVKANGTDYYTVRITCGNPGTLTVHGGGGFSFFTAAKL